MGSSVTICISHGSAGYSNTEKYIGEFFQRNGYNVIFNNYLGRNKIERLHWHNSKHCNDNYDVSLLQLCEIDLPDTPIVHIGLSFGGYVGIVNSEKFIKNYCFYPGILPMHRDIITRDFSNTTFFLPELDNWCTNTEDFVNRLLIPPISVNLHNSKHGFMLEDKARSFEVLHYTFEELFVDTAELNDFIFNHYILMKKYPSTFKLVDIESNTEEADKCLNYILADISDK